MLICLLLLHCNNIPLLKQAGHTAGRPARPCTEFLSLGSPQPERQSLSLCPGPNTKASCKEKGRQICIVMEAKRCKVQYLLIPNSNTLVYLIIIDRLEQDRRVLATALGASKLV